MLQFGPSVGKGHFINFLSRLIDVACRQQNFHYSDFFKRIVQNHTGMGKSQGFNKRQILNETQC